MNAKFSNPIYRQFTRHRRWPSEFAAVLVCIALSLTSALIVCALPALIPDATAALPLLGNLPIIYHLLRALILTVVLLAAASPLIAASTTAIATANATGDEAFALLRLTEIDAQVLVHAHLLAALFRLRWLWIALYGSVVPLLVAITVGNAVSFDTSVLYYLWHRWDDEFFVIVLVILSMTLLISALNWLSLTGGLWAGLRFKKIGSAVVSAAAIALLAWIGFAVITYPLLRAALRNPNFILSVVFTLLVATCVYGFAGIILIYDTQRQEARSS
jgi:hypothetical protein